MVHSVKSFLKVYKDRKGFSWFILIKSIINVVCKMQNWLTSVMFGPKAILMFIDYVIVVQKSSYLS